MSKRRKSKGRKPQRSTREASPLSRWPVVSTLFAAAIVIAILWNVYRQGAQTQSVGNLPGPLGGPDVAQDINTLIGKRAASFTLSDSENKRYAVEPGRGRPTVLIFHMGIT